MATAIENLDKVIEASEAIEHSIRQIGRIVNRSLSSEKSTESRCVPREIREKLIEYDRQSYISAETAAMQYESLLQSVEPQLCFVAHGKVSVSGITGTSHHNIALMLIKDVHWEVWGMVVISHMQDGGDMRLFSLDMFNNYWDKLQPTFLRYGNVDFGSIAAGIRSERLLLVELQTEPEIADNDQEKCRTIAEIVAIAKREHDFEVNEKTIRNWIDDKSLRHFRQGILRVFSKSDLATLCRRKS